MFLPGWLGPSNGHYAKTSALFTKASDLKPKKFEDWKTVADLAIIGA